MEEEHRFSTNEHSIETNTYSRSKTGDYQDSYSEDDDAVYVPFEY